MSRESQIKYRHDYCAPNYTITDINLDFNLDAKNTIITATSTVICQDQYSGPLLLNGKNLQLLNLQINAQEWHHYHLDSFGLVIEQLPKTFILTIKTLIHPNTNTMLEGLYLSNDTLCTQCEAEGFRHITFYLDRPDVLARFTTRILADKKRYPFLLSNGNCINYGDNSDGRHWVIWQDPFPKPCYLFALVAGDFDVLYDQFITFSGKKVELKLFVNRGNLNRAEWAMNSLKRAMRWDETRFGLEYDLGIYMVVAVDFFNMGAMENKGLNIFNSKYILAMAQTATDMDYLNIERVIGHEYFHNWTGNRITCRDWFQISLKEGLTVFRDQEFSADMGSRTVNRINNVRVIRSNQFVEDSSPMAHPVRPDKMMEINNFYTCTVYEKGAEVIRMIHTILGEKMFQSGMRYYVSHYDGKATTCEDFIVSMEEVSGIDLTLFRRWYSQSGTPIVTVRDNYNDELKQYTLHVKQMTPPTLDQQEKQVLHIPLDIELYDNQGQVIPLQYNGLPVNSVLNIINSEQTFVFDHVPSLPIPLLLREFSAPIKLDYPYSHQQLITLIHSTNNEFSCWDASQSLLSIYIRLNVARYQAGQSITLPLHVSDTFRSILLNSALDPTIISQILTLPSQNEIASLFDIVDPIAIHNVYNGLMRCLANELSNELLMVYSSSKTTKYQVKHRDIGLRALRNCCLHYLAFCNPDHGMRLIIEQYDHANNMTDTLAAISAAISAQLPCQTMLLNKFYQTWYHDGLVMDKWLSLQASSPSKDVLDQIKLLITNRVFSFNNPNRVRALIGTFTTNNLAAFHAIDGSGYAFLIEIIIELNIRNPQIASRIIEPLIQLKRYDLSRQSLMRKSLEQLKLLENLSNNLLEKINKALSYT